MAKEIKNPILWEIEFTIDNGNIEIASDVYYTVESDGVSERRPIILDVTPIERQLKQAAKNIVLAQIKAKEGM